MTKTILSGLGILLIAFGIFWATRSYYTYEAVTAEEQSQVLLEKIKTVAKLVTVEGYFSEVYDYQDYWKYDISPLRKKALVRIKAKVSVGYDLTQMKIEAFPDQKKMVISNLPDPSILSIDHDLDYYDISQGTFNSFTEADYNKINRNAKEMIRKNAETSDLFIAAEVQSNQLLDIIRFMVEGAGWTIDYTPRLKDLEPEVLPN